MSSVFLSYRREDSLHQVGRIYDRLISHFGAPAIFKDVDSIPLGSDFREVLTERVAGCKVLLAIIGDTWLTIAGKDGTRRLDESIDYVRIEIEAALRLKIPVIPVMVGKLTALEPSQLPASIRDLSFQHGCQVRTDPDFHGDMDRLIRGIEATLTKVGGGGTRIPESFGRYRVIRPLGKGGMGSVFLAEDTQLKRPIALKIPDFGPEQNPEARRRFLDEARSLALIKNPSLCPVLDSGEVGRWSYLAMEYIEGKSLDRTIPAQGLPARQVVALVGRLAFALREAHWKNIVHRKLRTTSIIFRSLGPNRIPVIVGFGQAHVDSSEDLRSAPAGRSASATGYLAPEQIRGDLREIGPACDIYALGVILYELLTGRLPDPSGVGRTFPRSNLEPALDAICSQAMATEVADRYPTMGEFAEALLRFLRSPASR